MRCRLGRKAGHLVLHLGVQLHADIGRYIAFPETPAGIFVQLRADCSADRCWARRVCGLRMLTANNSKKRLEARSPAAAISAGTRPRGGVNATLEFMPKPPVREMRNNCARR